MIKPMFTELRRLRWKLALAYTITTASVLTVLFVLLAVAIFRVNGSREQQARYVINVLRQVAARAAPLLAVEPIDSAGMSVLLATAMERSGLGQITPQAMIDLTTAENFAPIDLSESANVALLALDRNGILIASTRIDSQAPIGQPFDTTSLPGLANVLAGDLAQRNVLFDEATGRAVIVVPIQGSQRIGTLIYSAQGILPRSVEVAQMISSLGGLISTFTIAAAVVGLAFGLITAHGLTRRLRTIERVTTAWGVGDFAPRLNDHAADEIGQLSRQLNSVADQIQNLIRERQQFATLDERNRLARDLHDSVKQHVFAASMSLGAAQELWPINAAAAAILTNNAALATSNAQRELTDIIQALRPPELDRAGLAQAISDFAQQWATQTGIALTNQIDPTIMAPPTAEHALFRITQEALANVARHSSATTAVIQLRSETGRIVLSICDNGRGFDPITTRAGLGLQSMRERAEAISAQLTISTMNPGTQIQLTLPVHGQENNESTPS
jgi:NarL family two-component system sensor histidine kinase LiaS